jgi:tRNA-2-methylthio-N6-dimethylallyladenosine synthase
MNRTYVVETYGCQMNVHDSERIAGLLDEAGFTPVEKMQITNCMETYLS